MDNYQKVVNSLKRRKKGATAADICAATALPLATVRELLPKAADEYQGHLQVTSSGEILYHFPDGFTSRYRGLSANLKKAGALIFNALKTVSVFLFKVWIMVMLVGYFILFLAIALASVVLTIAIQSRSNDNRRSSFGGFNLFSLLWKIWFFSEITKPRYPQGNYPYGRNVQPKKQNRPMHKAIFSFVFGEEEPNKDWKEQQSKAVISYIQSNRGVISLAEYMTFSGENSMEAEKSLLAFCSKYSGSPEVTEEGTIVYRFDELLLRADSNKTAELLPPVKRLKTFSANPKKMNGWFIAINAVNLIFGSYFLFNSINTGLLTSVEQYENVSYLYGFTHVLLEQFVVNPLAVISIVLGLVPLVFSVLFWLIPALRYFFEKEENEEIKLANFKRIAFNKIWSSPINVDTNSFRTSVPECLPSKLETAKDRAIKELGAISGVDIEQSEDGKMLYSFKELEKEKAAIEKYRTTVDPQQSKLGEKIFDSAL